MQIQQKLYLILFLFFGISCTKAQTVYVTKTGEKYHVQLCRYLKYSSRSLDLQEAKDRGYTPCKVCHPVNAVQQVSQSYLNSGSSSSGKKENAKQCVAKTQTGRRCKRKTKNLNGRCYQHQ